MFSDLARAPLYVVLEADTGIAVLEADTGVVL